MGERVVRYPPKRRAADRRDFVTATAAGCLHSSRLWQTRPLFALDGQISKSLYENQENSCGFSIFFKMGQRKIHNGITPGSARHEPFASRAALNQARRIVLVQNRYDKGLDLQPIKSYIKRN
jgi:hypothetical protein